MLTKTNNITLLLLTHNSADSIERHFGWVKDIPLINEVIMVDDNSTDNTTKIAKKLFAKSQDLQILSRGLNGNFSSQRQFGVDAAKNDWILWLDNDEQPTGDMVKFLFNFDFTYFNYTFKRQDNFLGHDLLHGETNHLSFTRLFHRKYGHFQGAVHEIWQSTKPTTITNFVIYHRSHPDLNTFFQKINLYSTIRAQELFSQQAKPSLLKCLSLPLGKFLINYFFLLGFLDGTPGIIFALGMSFHSFLVRAKLWHLYRSPSSS